MNVCELESNALIQLYCENIAWREIVLQLFAQENVHHPNGTALMTLTKLTALPPSQKQCQNTNNSMTYMSVF